MDNPVETVEIEGELSNRSQRTRTEFLGSLKLNSTAYKQFNFASNLSFVSLLGHIETNVNFNNAPDLIDPSHTCSIRLMFARINNEDKKLEGTSTEALLEVKRPKSKVDWRFLIRYRVILRRSFKMPITRIFFSTFLDMRKKQEKDSNTMAILKFNMLPAKRQQPPFQFYFQEVLCLLSTP